ncbi:MAG: presqualene diphosphate synthase HpnD [Kiloniellales bacterium]|nr:presqualene diphosphate synthase HpnD [Kiloniellales bacterium]
MTVDQVQKSGEAGAILSGEREAEARDHVRRVVESSGSSFFQAMRMLDQEKRDAMYAIYAFCREVDDIADEEAPGPEKIRAIAAWREEIERLYGGQASTPTGRALLPIIQKFQLPKSEFMEVLNGMEMDARDNIVAPSMDELLLYCRRVAGAAGRLSICVFGDRSQAAEDLAIVQGEALQLTNILRDLGEDARRGRLYLPREALLETDISPTDPESVLNHPALPAACGLLAAIAEERFEKARHLIARCDRKALKPASMMLEAYRLILKHLVDTGWRDPWKEVSLPKSAKLWVALRYGLFG